MTYNFDYGEMIELINERGDVLEIASVQIIRPANPAMGIPEQKGYNWKRVQGYVVEQTRREMPLNNAPPATKGRFMAYILATTVTREDLQNADNRIRFNGEVWQFVYQKPHRDRGLLRLHELELTDKSGSIAPGANSGRPSNGP